MAEKDISDMNKSSSTDYKIIADLYDILIEPLIHPIKLRATQLASPIISNKKILEVGCGTGSQLMLLSNLDADLYGIDISASMLQKARRKAQKSERKNIKLIEGDATNLPFKENEFDLIITSFVLHEMNPDIREMAVDEILRVLSDNGKYIIIDYSNLQKNTLLSIIFKYGIRIIERFAGKQHYQNYLDFLNQNGAFKIANKNKMEITVYKKYYFDNISIFVLEKKQ